MRRAYWPLLCGAALLPLGHAHAAEKLAFGPPPAWVIPQTVPVSKPSEAPVAILLSDQQIAMEPGKMVSYNEIAVRLQKPEGLSAGNLSFSWDPSTEKITVNKVSIRRASKVIDVLAAGQSFTTLRRETNLEAAVLDGTLTANLLPEGLREGDIVEFATTTERSNPALKGHVEAVFGGWNGLPIESAHASLRWPDSVKVNTRQATTLPQPKRKVKDDQVVLEFAGSRVEPLIIPRLAPLRFRLGRIGNASDFASWAEVASLMRPLYDAAAAVPSSGSLHDEIERIRSTTSDPKGRAAEALKLVQDRVRYVALLMGAGGYVPASASETWSRRFGDCKGKTALLLGILRSLGIPAEPVLVNTEAGDALNDRQPMVGLFNHVLIRAHIAGKDYWLDGTRTGDTSLDGIETPDFGWVLPLTSNAQLIHLVPPVYDQPEVESRLSVDARDGIYVPAPTKAERKLRGDAAVATNTVLNAATAAQRDEFLKQYWRGEYDFVEISSTSHHFDPASRELRLEMVGTAKFDWSDGWLHVPDAELGYDPDFERPAGPFHDAPIAIAFPAYEKSRVEIRLPKSFLAGRKLGSAAVADTLVGVEYKRTTTLSGDSLVVEASQRSVVPEVAYREAIASKDRLKALADDAIYLPRPSAYVPTQSDLAALEHRKLASKEEFFERGLLFIEGSRLDEAIRDLSEAMKLDPEDGWPVANRALAYAWKRDYAAAEKDLAQADKLLPNNGVSLRARGLIAEQKGQLDKAFELYTRVLDKEPGNTFALSHKATVQQLQGKTDAALKDLDQEASKNASSPRALLTTAYSKAALGQFDEAEKDLLAAEALTPGLPQATALKAMIASGKHEYRTAIDAFTEALKNDPGSPRLLTGRAKAYRAIGDNDRALADSAAALKTADNTTEARLLRANIFLERGDASAAVGEADLIVKENPDSEFAFVGAGKIYDAFGLRAKAMKSLDRALALKPQAYIYLNRAQVRPTTDQAGRMSDLDAALKLEPFNSDAIATKARELELSGDLKQALVLYEQAEKIAPNERSIRFFKGLTMYRLGRTEVAEKLIRAERARAKTGSDFEMMCSAAAVAGVLLEAALDDCRQARVLNANISRETEALLLLRMGRFKEALESADQAVSQTHRAVPYMLRAIAQKAVGDAAKANADRSQALRLDADVEARVRRYGVSL